MYTRNYIRRYHYPLSVSPNRSMTNTWTPTNYVITAKKLWIKTLTFIFKFNCYVFYVLLWALMFRLWKHLFDQLTQCFSISLVDTRLCYSCDVVNDVIAYYIIVFYLTCVHGYSTFYCLIECWLLNILLYCSESTITSVSLLINEHPSK